MESDKNKASHQKVQTFRQHLAHQVSVKFCIDPANGLKPVMNFRIKEFLGIHFI